MMTVGIPKSIIMGKRPPDRDLIWTPLKKRTRPNMGRGRLIAITLGLLACGLAVLYAFLPPTLADREAVTAFLPSGIKLDTIAEYQWRSTLKGLKPVTTYREVTVERRLAEVGAKVVGGKLCDRSGREIRFYKHICLGTQLGDGTVEAWHKELAQLRSRYTVIEVAGCDPRNPPI
jgi:hypothetical protein